MAAYLNVGNSVLRRGGNGQPALIVGRGEYTYLAMSPDGSYAYEGLSIVPALIQQQQQDMINTWELTEDEFYGTRRLTDASVVGLYEYYEMGLGGARRHQRTIRPTVRIVPRRAGMQVPVPANMPPVVPVIEGEYPSITPFLTASIRDFLSVSLGVPAVVSDETIAQLYVAAQYGNWEAVKDARKKSARKCPQAHALYKWVENLTDTIKLEKRGSNWRIGLDLIGKLVTHSFTNLQEVSRMLLPTGIAEGGGSVPQGFRELRSAAECLTTLYTLVIPASLLDDCSSELDVRLRDIEAYVREDLGERTVDMVNLLFEQDQRDLRNGIGIDAHRAVNDRTQRLTWTQNSERWNAWRQHKEERREAAETARDVTAAALAAVDNRVADSMQRVAVLEAELRGMGKRNTPPPGGNGDRNVKQRVMTDEGRIQHYIDMAGGVPTTKPPIPSIPDGTWVVTDRKSPHYRKTINMKALRGDVPQGAGARVYLTNTGIKQMGLTGTVASAYQRMRAYLLHNRELASNDAVSYPVKK